MRFPTAAPLTIQTYAAARALARDRSMAFYDALIVGAAVEAGCDRFGDCVIGDPFRGGGF
ncbi:MAG TPA: hypothetical protein VLI91_05820 [Roseiarcus sp.]|nr:hypothetical protein [Roseiarcus sp.]